jgi:hypothetical protein
MKGDIFDNFAWHSTIGIDEALEGNKQFISKLPNTKIARKEFIATSDDANFLIHKTTKSLWRISEDKQSIEPLFPTDVLTSSQASELEE